MIQVSFLSWVFFLYFNYFFLFSRLLNRVLTFSIRTCHQLERLRSFRIAVIPVQANSHVSQSYAPDHNHNARNAAFTLIELLVVIAIIGILLGILIPSLKKAKEQVRFVLCKSNLKNYGVVANMYISDNRDTMPNAWTSFYNRHEEYPPDDDYPQAEPHRYCRWHNPRFDLTLNPQYAGPFWSYLEMKKVQICPKFVEIARRFGDRHPQHVETIPIVPNYNYAMNQHLGERKITEIRNQSQVFFFSEENLWLTDGWSTYAFNDTALCVIKDAHNDLWDSIQPWDCFGTFHNAKDPDLETGVVNAVFVDGHVQTVHREESQRYAIIDK